MKYRSSYSRRRPRRPFPLAALLYQPSTAVRMGPFGPYSYLQPAQITHVVQTLEPQWFPLLVFIVIRHAGISLLAHYKSYPESSVRVFMKLSYCYYLHLATSVCWVELFTLAIGYWRCVCGVQCCFTAAVTIGTIRDEEPRTATSTFTQPLSSELTRYSGSLWSWPV